MAGRSVWRRRVRVKSFASSRPSTLVKTPWQDHLPLGDTVRKIIARTPSRSGPWRAESGTPVTEYHGVSMPGVGALSHGYKGRLIATGWADFGGAWLGYLCCNFQVAADEVYIYDS